MSYDAIDVFRVWGANDNSVMSLFPGSRLIGFAFQTENGSLPHPGGGPEKPPQLGRGGRGQLAPPHERRKWRSMNVGKIQCGN